MFLSIRTQKFPFLALSLLLILGTLAQISRAATASDTVNLAWDSNPESDIAGYRVHYGTTSGDFSSILEVGTSPGATLSGLESGATYYCAVQAFNTSGLAGGLSSEISFTIEETQQPSITVARVDGGESTPITESVSFGDVELGSTGVTETFVIQNLGLEPLVGLSITANESDFQVASLDRASLAPGEIITFNVSFTPSAAGLRTTVLRINLSDEDEPLVDIMLNGTGIARPMLSLEKMDGELLGLQEAVISFGSVLVGSAATPVIFVVRNTGSAALTGLQATLSESTGSDFVLDAPPTPLEPGETAYFTVGFNPTGGGTQFGSIRITSDSATQETLEIGLVGNGIAVPEIAVIQNNRTNLTSGTSSANFGNCAIGSTSASQTFTIKNSGSAPLTKLSLSCDDADFNIGSLNTSALSSGSSTTFKVNFEPTSTEVRLAQLVISSNDADESRFVITLTAKGFDAPEIGVEQSGETLKDGAAFINFGTVETGSTGKGRTFTIRNSGDAKLENLALILNGLHPDNFIVSPLQTRALAPGASTTFKINFSPTKGGTRWAAIHIASNDGDEKFFDIVLTGNSGRESNSAPSAAPPGKIVQPAAGAVPAKGIEVIGGRKYLTLTITKTPGFSPVPGSVEVSSNLVEWSSGKSHTTVLVDNSKILKVRDNTPVSANAKRYIRIKPASKNR